MKNQVLHEIFFNHQYKCATGTLISYFKINTLFLCCSLFHTKEYFNPQVRIKKLDFKKNPQRILKPIRDQNLFSSFQSWHSTVKEGMRSYIKPFWRHLMLKNQTIWLAERFLGSKLKNQTVKLLEIAQSICCFYASLPTYKKTRLHSSIQSLHIEDLNHLLLMFHLGRNEVVGFS